MIRIVFVTCPPEKSEAIARHLLDQRVVACVNILPLVRSRYWWEGRVESADESLLIIKCDGELLDTVIEKVKEVHPHKVPEIIALPVEGGNLDYLEWVKSAPREGAGTGPRSADVTDVYAALDQLPGGSAKPAGRKPAASLSGSQPASKAAGEPPAAGGGVVTMFIQSLPPCPAEVRERVGGMRVALLGPPGVGKGTQARLLAARYGLQHLSIGDIIMRAVRGGTEFGRISETYTKAGKLVPDEYINALVREQVTVLGDSGFVLDGFPRTMAQAQALEEAGKGPNFVFYVNAPQEVLISRLTKRSYCDCGAAYGPSRQPAHAGKCDECGKDLYQRDDDQPRHILTRLEEYNSKTRELLRLYRDRLRPVDGSLTMDEIFKQVCKYLEKLGA